MKINKHISRAVSVMLSFAMAFGGVIPAHAAEVTVSESLLEETGLAGPVLEEADGEETESGLEAYADSESRYEQIEVNYSQASRYSVTIPKTITLGTDKRSPYSIKVEGDIVANKQVCVVPVDGIADTEVFDFYMSDQIAGSTKEDVAAEISQSKFYWDHEEAARGYEETDNHIIAEGLSAGKWKGTFQMEISMRTDPSHIHNYVGEVTKEPTCTEAGEKTYTCDCGDSYTESIDPTGHHYEKGECTDCGEKDPDHAHSYTEEITKQPSCTEEGEKTYTCICGDSYTEKIPATGHHFVDGECEECGEKDPNAHTHSYKEEVTKEPTCTEAGEKIYTCECGDSYTEEIPATGHNYKEEVTKEPTCTEAGEKTYTCECGDGYTEEIPKTEHDYGEDDKCTDCGKLNPDHEHDYKEEVTKEPTCTEAGEKTYTCICGDSYTEEIPATGHHYENGTCTDCGEKDPDAFEKIKVGDTETRVIAGQTLEFICIDDAYVDATGAPVGALFIAKDYLPTNVLTLSKSEPEWALTNARGVLNGDKSDLTDLITVNTTVSKRYTKQNTAAKYDMGTIDKYGDPVEAGHTETTDKVFILSLEEAVRYNKVMINDREISVMWDLNCDGTVELNKFEKNRGGYYLRTAYQNPTDGYYLIWWDGQVSWSSAYAGVRPCYVKDNNLHKHNYAETIIVAPTCRETGEKECTCECGHSYREIIPATGHDYVDGECINCGRKEPFINVGDTETRVIAGQTLEFICIDDAYVDATGNEIGALFIAKDYIPGNILTLNQSEKDWASTNARTVLNGETSDLNDLILANTTITKTYSSIRSKSDFNMGTIDDYGTVSDYDTESTRDKVFILSLEEAIKYNKAVINDKEISVMWDLNCDGEINKVPSANKYGYYLRTPYNAISDSNYVIYYYGSTLNGRTVNYGIRPCYVKANNLHTHNYVETVKEAACIEDGEKTYICDCGDTYTETIPAKGHNYVNDICTNCGKKRILKVGDTETRVIAGQELEFICIDNSYVDATGKEAGALFIAKDFISGNILQMGGASYSFIKDWALNPARTKLNGDTSDLTDLISVDTTVKKAYSGIKNTKNYDMETISSYGAASDYDAPRSEDKVFILSLEEAIKYNKVVINDKEISVMWDLDCDGAIDFNTASTYRYGYYLRTPKSGTDKLLYGICYDGSLFYDYATTSGIRPCYVRDNSKSICKHNYIENITKAETCTEAGEAVYICSNCGDSYTEEIPASHHYNNNICTGCGKEYDPYEIAPYGYLEDWNYTLDDTNNIVTLNYYIGTKTDVIVYANYVISGNGKTYKTELASNRENASGDYPYMFNDGANTGIYSEIHCSDIKTIKFSKNIDTSNVTNMRYMFFGCSSLTSIDFGCFDTSNVTDMRYMFFGCYNLTSPDFSNFDTSKVTNMSHMFDQCYGSGFSNLDVSNFDTSNVTDMSYMFYNCQYVSNFNVRNFDTSNVVDMGYMFAGCGKAVLGSINLDVSSFDTSKVKNMSHMFELCSVSYLNVSNFDTSNVTDMSYMFKECSELTALNVSNFDTGNVTNMSNMFYNCWHLTSLDLCSFDTSKVTNMSYMFTSCDYLKTIYVTQNKWKVPTGSSATKNMFTDCGTKTVTYK